MPTVVAPRTFRDGPLSSRLSIFTVCVIVSALLASGGCRRPAAVEYEIEDYGQLPYLSRTQHRGLQDELARIEADGGTPVQLAQASRASAPADEGNAAVALQKALPPKKIEDLFEELEQTPSIDRLLLDDKALGASEGHSQEARQPSHGHSQGGGAAALRLRVQSPCAACAPTSASSDAVRVACLLEEIVVAEMLADHHPEQTIESLQFIFQWIERLSRVQSLMARSEAARLRHDAFEAVAAVAEHPATDEATLKALLQMVLSQLENWPDERQAWIGERAAGMHVFEMIHDGHLLSFLTIEEIEEFEKDGTTEALKRAAAGSFDDDEILYLRTMRTIIDSCSQPYYERESTLRDIKKQLADKRGTSTEPIVTVRILLDGFETAHLLHAEDRARCEAWALALAGAFNKDIPDIKRSPVTGNTYRVVRQDGQVIVWGAADASFEPARVNIPK